MYDIKKKKISSILAIILVVIFSFTFLFGSRLLSSTNVAKAAVEQDVDSDDDDGEGEEEDDSWEDDDFGSGNAVITINAGSHGTIKINGSTSSPQTLIAGQEYTVTITPSNGYEIDTVKITNNGSLFESLTSSLGGASTSVARNIRFPAGNDTISATFSEPEEQYGDGEPSTRVIGYELDTSKSALDSGTVYKDQDGTMYYCANEALHGPAHSGGSIRVKLQTSADAHQKAFDYLMYYGYPRHKKINGKKYSAKNAHDLTQIAIWMILNPDYRSSSNAKMNAPAKAFAKKAKDYDGKNKKINGTAILYYPKGHKKQPFITTTTNSKLYIKKKASGAGIEGNELYTLENTVFKVYDTKSDAESGSDPKKTLTVHDGETDDVELGKEVYYFKETSATPGYKLDKEVVKADLTSGSKSFTAKNDPIVVPFCVLNVKEPNATLGPLSDPYDLTTRFKVEYYDTKSKDVDSLSESSSLAVFNVTSNKLGQITLNKSSMSFTKGKTHFDQFMDGYNGLPLGLYKITETEAPKGFKSNSEPSYFIFDDGTDFSKYNRTIDLWTKNGKNAFSKTELGGCESVTSTTINNITRTLTPIVSDEKFPIGLIAEKRDNDTEGTTPQGDVADFSGIKMQVINNGPKIATKYDNNGHALTTERAVDTGGVIYEGVTDTNGVFKVPEILPQAEQTRGGTKYTIKEVESKDGYHLNNSWSISVTRYQEEITASTTIDTRTNTDRVTCDNKGAIENAVWRGGIEIEKDDFYLGKSEAINGKDHDATKHEGTDLNNIEFTITNASTHSVIVPKDIDLSKKDSTAPTDIDYKVSVGANTDDRLKEVKPGETVGIITTSWDEKAGKYMARTQIDALPYGTYKIKETKTNRYYELTDKAERTVTVHENGKYATTGKIDGQGEAENLIFRNKPWRQNMYFKKKMENEQPGTYIPFKITSTTTGESHYIVTDSNGEYDSGKTKHSQNTNGYDEYIEQCLNANDPSDRIVNSEHLASMRTNDTGDQSTVPGLWFCKGEDGTSQPVDDTLAALPYGKYILQEIPCTNNKGMEMIERTFWIAKDENKVMLNEEKNNRSDLGTLRNEKANPEISTTAKDALTETDLGVVNNEVTLIDTVAYKGLEADKHYKLVGTLHTPDGDILKISDKKVTSEKEFDPEVTGNGSIDVEFKLDTTELKGKDTVVYEKLYVLNEETNKYESVKNKGIPVVHDDPDDPGQTLHFPRPLESMKCPFLKVEISMFSFTLDAFLLILSKYNIFHFRLPVIIPAA